ncbi:MAG: DUF3284 domain-containing protein [Bacillota bacterium]
MKVTIPLNIQAEDFFVVIADSVRQDLKADETLTVEKGLTYEKKLPTALGSIYNAKVEITEYAPNTLYSVVYATSKSTVTTTYHVEESTEGILIHYEEVETFVSKLETWNAKLMKHFYEKSRKKQLIKKMNGLSDYINSKK